MLNNNNTNQTVDHENCCFIPILKVIDVLQRNAEKIDNLDAGCDRPFLGNCGNVACFNTRPIQFYTCNNTLFDITYLDNGVSRTSNVFRIEKIEGCCVTCRILQTDPSSTDPNRPYLNTDQFVTINLRCVGAIQCLPDVIIDCL